MKTPGVMVYGGWVNDFGLNRISNYSVGHLNNVSGFAGSLHIQG